MICASRSVPKVATANACVSPRVKIAEPWVRGNTPVQISNARTVSTVRPSIRGSPAMIRPRTIWLSSAVKISTILPSLISSSSAVICAITSALIASICS